MRGAHGGRGEGAGGAASGEGQHADESRRQHEESQRLLSTLQLEWKEREENGRAEFERELQKQKDAGVRAVSRLTQEQETREATLVKDLDRRLHSLQEKQIEDLRGVRGEWEEKVNHLKNELKAFETERMVELHRHALELETERNDSRRRNAEASKWEQKTSSLMQDAELAQLEAGALKQQLEQARKELEFARSGSVRSGAGALSGTRREIALEQELTHLKSILQTERDRGSGTGGDRDVLWREKYFDAQQEADRLRQQLDAREQSFQASKRAGALLGSGPFDAHDADELRRVRELLSDREDLIRTLENQVRTAEREAGELAGEGQAAEVRIARERLRAQEDEIHRLRGAKADLEREKDRLRGEVQRLEETVRYLKQELARSTDTARDTLDRGRGLDLSRLEDREMSRRDLSVERGGASRRDFSLERLTASRDFGRGTSADASRRRELDNTRDTYAFRDGIASTREKLATVRSELDAVGGPIGLDGFGRDRPAREAFTGRAADKLRQIQRRRVERGAA